MFAKENNIAFDLGPEKNPLLHFVVRDFCCIFAVL